MCRKVFPLLAGLAIIGGAQELTAVHTLPQSKFPVIGAHSHHRVNLSGAQMDKLIAGVDGATFPQ